MLSAAIMPVETVQLDELHHLYTKNECHEKNAYSVTDDFCCRHR